MSAPVIPINRNAWKSRILTKQSKRGDEEILHVAANAVTILKNDPAWRGVIGFDRLEQGIVCRKPAPWYDDDAPDGSDPSKAWSESDGLRIANWLMREYSLNVSESTAFKAAVIVAESNTFDPLLDWINSLRGTWDGVPRVATVLSRYFGAADTEYTRFIGKAFLVGSIARGVFPGCKMDTMWIVEGKQGIFKSQCVEALYGAAHFRETPIDLHSNDRFLALRGCWCREWPELDGLGKADANRVKSYLSPKVDDYRAPYGRGMIRAPRRCVFVATVNPPQLGYLVDESGNRRMWPFEAGVTRPIDLAGIERDRSQLWAEALSLYDAGVKWWPRTREEHALCNGEQSERMAAEVWSGKIAEWLTTDPRVMHRSEVTIRQILTDCLSIPLERQDKSNSARVGACLARAGWIVGGQRGTAPRERYYVPRPVEVTPADDDVERAAIQLQ